MTVGVGIYEKIKFKISVLSLNGVRQKGILLRHN